jgi:hypothetical protein
MVKFNDLIEYFEYLAANHTGIGHKENETHFFRFELEDVLTSLKGDIHFKALILEGYDFGFGYRHSDNLLKQRNGAFIIIDRVMDENDFDAITQAYDECEEIGDEIIVRIASDKRNRNVPVVRDFQIEGIQGNMIANAAEGYYGMRYTYSLVSPRTNDVDTTRWEDDGEYPEI